MRPSTRAAVLALGVIALVARASSGQSARTFHQSVTGTVGLFGNDRDEWGVSMTGGLMYANKFLGLALNPIDFGARASDPDDKYGRVETADGGSRCLDKATHQSVNGSNCKSMLYAASAEAFAALPLGARKSVGFGAGYRVGSSPGIYGTASVYLGPMNGPSTRFTLRLGRSFFDLGAGGTIKI